MKGLNSFWVILPNGLPQVCPVPLNMRSCPDSKSTKRFSAENRASVTIASDC